MADRALKHSSIAVDIAVLVNCLGAACSYVIVATDSFMMVLGPDGPRQPWTLLSIAIMVPFSCLRTMDSLSYTSGIAVACVFFVVVVIGLFTLQPSDIPILHPCPPSATFNGTTTLSCPPGETKAIQPPLSTLSAFASMTMAYQCQMAVPSIGNEIRNPSRSRMFTLFSCSLTFAWLLYTLVGLCGYGTFGDKVSECPGGWTCAGT